MIVRNESGALRRCLPSVRGVADEVIVVDTGSTDDSVAVARTHGARVLEVAWADDFSAARNHGLAVARGRWILVLDADEWLPEESRVAIGRLVREPPRRAYQLIQRSALPDGNRLDVAIVRLFPRDVRVRFERPIHEQVNTSLERARVPIVDCDISINHEGYARAEAMPAKVRRNRALIEAALARDPTGDPHLRYFLGATYLDAGEFEQAAATYDACVRQCGSTRPRLAAAARLKAAECHGLAGAWREASARLPVAPAPGLHPLACALRATWAEATGDPAAAVPWWEQVLAEPGTVHLPPVAVGPMKLRALNALADHWARVGRKEVAVALLRLAVAATRGRVPTTGRALADHYRAALRPIGRRIAA